MTCQRYQAWLNRDGNREKKRQDSREAYHYLKSLGICCRVGCRKDALPGLTTCETHRNMKRKKSRV